MAESTAPHDPNVQTTAEVTNDFPPKVHFLKTLERPFQQVWDGHKLAELRSGHDRDFRIGDLLMLREIFLDPFSAPRREYFIYTGRNVVAEITHITRCADWMGTAAGGAFVVLSFKVLSKSDRGPKA